TYIWIDGTGLKLECKTRTLDATPVNIADYPIWNYGRDGYIKPVADYPDPFLGGQNKLVLCETLNTDMKPTATNHRANAALVMEQANKYAPWFGMKQEYCLFDHDGSTLGGRRFVYGNYTPRNIAAVGREIVQAHYRLCLHAGLKIYSTNAGRARASGRSLSGPTMESPWETRCGWPTTSFNVSPSSSESSPTSIPRPRTSSLW
ncbi:hypothetical protein PMAYCL1PPCAC_14733, partial [Pristionchus mayeri]